MSDKKYCPLQDWNENKAPKDMHCKRDKCEWWQPYLTIQKEDRGRCAMTYLVGLKYVGGE